MTTNQQDFCPLAGQTYHTCMLPGDEMREINRLKETRERMVMGVQFCAQTKVVKLLMGNYATITIPCEMFLRDANGLEPNFNFPFIEDYGFDIFFGDYEVDLKSVLFI